MIAAAPFSDMNIPESLGISALGIIIVFAVLVFLMCIIYVMTSIIKRFSAKKAVSLTGGQAAQTDRADRAADETAHTADVTAADDRTLRVTETAGAIEAPQSSPSLPASTAEKAATEQMQAAPQEAPAALTPALNVVYEKSYKVVIGGVIYEAIAEIGENAAYEPYSARKYKIIVDGVEYDVDSETGDAKAVQAAQIADARERSLEFLAPKKYKIMIDGALYEVDTGAGEFSPSAASGARKYRVVIDGAEYDIEAEAGADATAAGTGRVE